MPKRGVPGLVMTMSSTAGSPQKAGATRPQVQGQSAQRAVVTCIETTPLPASRKVST
jgi:hypothetical protein